MSATSSCKSGRPTLNDNVLRNAKHRFRPMIQHSPATRRCYRTFGMEILDHLGIDIDQDPSAFAQFLELKNQV